MKNRIRIHKLMTALLTLCILFACMAGTAMAEDSCTHTFTQNAAGKWVCSCNAQAVAKVDSVFYTDFAAALADWTNGTTLTLLDNVTHGSTIELGEGAARTFDGGKYTLTLTGGMTEMVNKGELTIASGTIIGEGSQVIWNRGTLTITGGTVSALAPNATAVINYGSMTLDGGALNGKSGIENSHAGIAYLKSGTVTATQFYALINLGEAFLSGADLTALNTNPAIICHIDSETTISGGTLTSSGPDVIRLECGKLTIEDAARCDGWTISNINGAADIGTDIVLPAGCYMFVDDMVVNTLEDSEYGTIRTPAVTFDANGGKVDPASAATKRDGTLEALPEATRTGYTFDGWFTEKRGGTLVTVATIFTSDTTIYAHWMRIPVPPEIPQTGDHSAFGFWLALMSMAGTALLLLRRRAHN